jgi:hypothetical protein
MPYTLLEASAADARRGRFYPDRLDLDDPSEPRQLAKVNVPGSRVTFDPASRRAVTREQVRTVVVTWISREDRDKRFASSEWFAASAGSTPSAQSGLAVVVFGAPNAAALRG